MSTDEITIKKEKVTKVDSNKKENWKYVTTANFDGKIQALFRNKVTGKYETREPKGDAEESQKKKIQMQLEARKPKGAGNP